VFAAPVPARLAEELDRFVEVRRGGLIVGPEVAPDDVEIVQQRVTFVLELTRRRRAGSPGSSV
jgi:hypothetical protein